MKVCSKCRVEKPLDQFFARSDRPGTHESSCKQCKLDAKHSRTPVKTKLIDLGLKKCCTCKQTREVANFGVRAQTGPRAGKLRSSCLECEVVLQQQWRDRQAAVTTKICSKCGVEKAASDFPTRGNKGPRAGELKSFCKVCQSADAKERRERDPSILEREKARAEGYPNTPAVISKVCTGCQSEKPASEFRKKATPSGLDNRCKLCRSEYEKNWRRENPEAYRANNQRNYQNHRAARQKTQREYYVENKEQVAAANNKRIKRREKTDHAFLLYRRLKTQIRNGLLAGGGKNRRTCEYLGCSWDKLRAKFEAEFSPGMTWDNYGVPKSGERGWHIGHIRPVAGFNLSDPEQIAECWHFSNLRPQWAEENLSASASFNGVDFSRLRAEQYSVEPVEYGRAKLLVEEFHYSKTCPRAGSRVYGLVHRESGALLGAAVFGPAMTRIARSFADGKGICLHRVVVKPGVANNAASYLIGRSLRLLKSEGAWDFAFTYADTWQGHSGAIYRASNWEYLGLTIPKPVWTQNGKQVCRRVGLTKTLTAAELLSSGAVFQGNFPKHRFRYFLRPPKVS